MRWNIIVECVGEDGQRSTITLGTIERLPRVRCADQRRTGQIHRVVGTRFIAGAGRGGMNPQILSGPDLSTVRQLGRGGARCSSRHG